MITSQDFQKIRVPFEIEISNRLFETLEGNMLESIIKEAKTSKEENYWRYLLEGHSFKVTKELLPDFYKLCMDVQKSLCFDEPIEYYITNTATANAMTLARLEEDEPHIININSSLVGLMDDDEMRFIIGHEIGHLISRNANISRLISFVFPNPESKPLMLQHQIALWDKFAELTADRFGLIANPNPGKCYSVFFKLASGLDPKRLSIDIETYLADNEKRLDFFKGNLQAFNLATHPVNPIRIKAIDLFSKSDLWNQIQNGTPLEADRRFEDLTTELSKILYRLGLGELDFHRMHFLATAGLLVSLADKEMDEKEYLTIINNLASYQVFPEDFLDSIAKSGGEKINAIFMESALKILEINPKEREEMVRYLINLCITDNKISETEMQLIFKMGTALFGYSRKELAQMIAASIQQNYMPKLHHF